MHHHFGSLFYCKVRNKHVTKVVTIKGLLQCLKSFWCVCALIFFSPLKSCFTIVLSKIYNWFANICLIKYNIIDLLTFILKFKVFNLILFKRKEFKRRKKKIQLLYVCNYLWKFKCGMMRISCVLKKAYKKTVLKMDVLCQMIKRKMGIHVFMEQIE